MTKQVGAWCGYPLCKGSRRHAQNASAATLPPREGSTTPQKKGALLLRARAVRNANVPYSAAHKPAMRKTGVFYFYFIFFIMKKELIAKFKNTVMTKNQMRTIVGGQSCSFSGGSGGISCSGQACYLSYDCRSQCNGGGGAKICCPGGGCTGCSCA